MSKLILPSSPTLSDYQRYVAEMIKERGFTDESLAQTYMLFTEEVGELAKAARQAAGMKLDAKAARQNIEHEVADVFILFIGICNQLGVDVERAFRNKEELNKQRTWK